MVYYFHIDHNKEKGRIIFILITFLFPVCGLFDGKVGSLNDVGIEGNGWFAFLRNFFGGGMFDTVGDGDKDGASFKMKIKSKHCIWRNSDLKIKY